jgi:hydrogenase expression/formation protein HypC
MCLGVPGKITEIDGKTATAEIMGATRKISLDFLKKAEIGDYVLIHAGCAIQVIDEEEALETLKLFNELREII